MPDADTTARGARAGRRCLATVLVVALALLCAPAAASGGDLPRLSTGEAKYYSAKALSWKFRAQFRHGYGHKISCRERLSRTNVRCQRVSRVYGDLAFFGKTRIWFTERRGRVLWNYAFRIKRFDEYCAAVENRPPRECVKTFIVR